MANNDCKTYSFTDEDMILTTFSLRRLAETTASGTVRKDCIDLINHIERMQTDHYVKELRAKESR
jgi:hypothetical protein